MEAALRAGMAVFNDGHYHDAHDAWEEPWLDLAAGSRDERLLHGLIQYSAAIHHAHERNWEGATGLANSALEYLAGLPDEYRDVDLETVRSVLVAIAQDPAWIERTAVPAMHHAGEPVTYDRLAVDGTCIAAEVRAHDLADEAATIVEEAAEQARRDHEQDRSENPFARLLAEFLRPTADREIVLDRMRRRLDRRADRDRAVDDLFEP